MRKSKSPSFCPFLVQPSTIEAGTSVPTHLRTPGGDIVTLTPVVLRSGEVSFLKSKTSAQAPKQCAAPCKVNLYGKEGKGCRKVVRLASGTTELFIYRMYQISWKRVDGFLGISYLSPGVIGATDIRLRSGPLQSAGMVRTLKLTWGELTRLYTKPGEKEHLTSAVTR